MIIATGGDSASFGGPCPRFLHRKSKKKPLSSVLISHNYTVASNYIKTSVVGVSHPHI